MSTDIRYKISNRLVADNTTLHRLSGINLITGKPIYRDSFTHSKDITEKVEKAVSWLTEHTF